MVARSIRLTSALPRAAFCLAVLVGLGVPGPRTLLAAPAYREAFILEQSDGRIFYARTWGDEWQNGTETVDDYTVLFEETILVSPSKRQVVRRISTQSRRMPMKYMISWFERPQGSPVSSNVMAARTEAPECQLAIDSVRGFRRWLRRCVLSGEPRCPGTS